MGNRKLAGSIFGGKRRMTPEQFEQLNYHIEAIAQLLYEETNTESIQDLEGIEQTIRTQTLTHITPKIGVFFCEKEQGQLRAESEK
jgi:hypothetical protein